MKKCKMNLEFIIPNNTNISHIMYNIRKIAFHFKIKELKINSTTKEIEDE